MGTPPEPVAAAGASEAVVAAAAEVSMAAVGDENEGKKGRREKITKEVFEYCVYWYDTILVAYHPYHTFPRVVALRPRVRRAAYHTARYHFPAHKLVQARQLRLGKVGPLRLHLLHRHWSRRTVSAVIHKGPRD